MAGGMRGEHGRPAGELERAPAILVLEARSRAWPVVVEPAHFADAEDPAGIRQRVAEYGPYGVRLRRDRAFDGAHFSPPRGYDGPRSPVSLHGRVRHPG